MRIKAKRLKTAQILFNIKIDTIQFNEDKSFEWQLRKNKYNPNIEMNFIFNSYYMEKVNDRIIIGKIFTFLSSRYFGLPIEELFTESDIEMGIDSAC